MGGNGRLWRHTTAEVEKDPAGKWSRIARKLEEEGLIVTGGSIGQKAMSYRHAASTTPNVSAVQAVLWEPTTASPVQASISARRVAPTATATTPIHQTGYIAIRNATPSRKGYEQGERAAWMPPHQDEAMLRRVSPRRSKS